MLWARLLLERNCGEQIIYFYIFDLFADVTESSTAGETRALDECCQLLCHC